MGRPGVALSQKNQHEAEPAGPIGKAGGEPARASRFVQHAESQFFIKRVARRQATGRHLLGESSLIGSSSANNLLDENL